ncbi:MAG: type II secretion system protein [bacterium]|nr:type II secretion system protein [bacterium]
MKQYKKGFTLIELLVVIAIIGILSTLAVVSLGNARTRARDSKRVADIRNTQTALEIYYTDNIAYPPVTTDAACIPATSLEGCCLDNRAVATGSTVALGWHPACDAADRLITVPNDPRNNATADEYVYSIDGGNNYRIQFNLESGAGDLTGAGLKCATPAGISNAPCS